MKTLSQLDLSASLEEIEETLANTTIFDKIEFSGITKESIRAKLEDLRTRQVPQRTVFLNQPDEEIVFYWFKNWLHPMLKHAVTPSPRCKLGCSKAVLERDMARDSFRMYENGQQNYVYTLADVEAWLDN